MGDNCYYKEFLKELDYVKNEMTVWGINYDIMQQVWCLKRKIKEFFPMNEVPKSIMNSLKLLEERMKIANDQMSITCEEIILQVEEMRNKEHKNA